MIAWLKSCFSLGYGNAEWLRERHVFFSVMLGWLAVDLSPWMTGKLDDPTFKAHAWFALSIALTSIIKNVTLNNEGKP
jgi:hypothetical protein